MDELNKLDLNLYRTFLEVAKTGSISKAATSLYVSQPAVSHNIKTLEKQLGCKLFNRTTKGVELTVNAQKLLFYIENAYNTIATGCKIVKESTNLISGEIRLGVPTHIGIFLISKYIQKFNEKYPGIKFYIVNKSTNEMIEMLEKRKLDLIVDSYPINSNRGDITVSELIEVDNCFIGNEKYKEFANNGKIKIENIKKYPLLLPPRVTSTRQALENEIRHRVGELDGIIDVPTTEVMLDLVKRGLGIGYFLKDSVLKYTNSGRLFEIQVDEKLPKTKICIAYVEDFLANAPKQFCDMLKFEIKNSIKIREKRIRLIVTEDCIYNCSICHKEGMKSSKQNLLNSEDFAYIYEIANKEYGIEKVNITGGEPLMREDIGKILIKLKEKGAKVIMTTNGYFLDKNMNIINLLHKINISIHTLDKEKFENISRKKDSYDKVINNIKIIRARYPTLNMGINATIIKDVNSNVQEIEELIKLANSLKVELKLIELYPKTAKNFISINVVEPILKRLGFKLYKSTFRKKIYSNGNQEIILARCTCNIVSESKYKQEVCKNNNDIYIMPDGKISLCREKENEIDILKEVKDKKREALVYKLETAINTMGDSCNC